MEASLTEGAEYEWQLLPGPFQCKDTECFCLNHLYVLVGHNTAAGEYCSIPWLYGCKCWLLNITELHQFPSWVCC